MYCKTCILLSTVDYKMAARLIYSNFDQDANFQVYPGFPGQHSLKSHVMSDFYGNLCMNA